MKKIFTSILKSFKLAASAIVIFQFSTAYSQNVVVDFSVQQPVHSMSGFLHGIYDTWSDPSTITIPDDSLILPMKAQYWRIGTYHPAVYNKIKNTFNPEMILVVSDIYGYPFNWPVAPYLDTAAWLTKIDLICANTSGFDIIYDIWNEPDVGFFWNGTYQQFLETYRLAHNRIRQNLGSNVKIAGPSLGYMDTSLIRQFCDFAVLNGLKIDVFAQHWLEPYIPGNSKLLSDLNWLQSNIINNPAYQSLQIQKLVIAEIVGEPQQYKPGPILSHFYFLEQGGADGACKGCWDAMDGSGTNNCFNSTLDGLLTSGTFLKRPAWWVYKTYADMEERRYTTTSTDPNMVAIAGRLAADTNTVRVMVGQFTDYQPPWVQVTDFTLNNILSLPSIQANDTLEIMCFKIPDKGTDTLGNPILIWIDTIPVSQLSVVPITADIDSNCVVYLDMRKLGSSAPTGITLSTHPDVRVFPIPIEHILNIYFEKRHEKVELHIYNVMGQCISRNQYHQVNSIVTNIQGNAGLYLLGVKMNEEAMRFYKVIKE